MNTNTDCKLLWNAWESTFCDRNQCSTICRMTDEIALSHVATVELKYPSHHNPKEL